MEVRPDVCRSGRVCVGRCGLAGGSVFPHSRGWGLSPSTCLSILKDSGASLLPTLMIWGISPAGVCCHETNRWYSPRAELRERRHEARTRLCALSLGPGKAPSSTSTLSGGVGLWEAVHLRGLSRRPHLIQDLS